jgi:hypothetical protein
MLIYYHRGSSASEGAITYYRNPFLVTARDDGAADEGRAPIDDDGDEEREFVAPVECNIFEAWYPPLPHEGDTITCVYAGEPLGGQVDAIDYAFEDEGMVVSIHIVGHEVDGDSTDERT